MKMVQAIIKPFQLDEVREALGRLGVQGLTVSEVLGFGRQKGHSEVYRGAEYAVDLLPKLMLEVVIRDDLLDEVIDTIQEKARTGQIGDGKIFVREVEHAVRIRTEEIDEAAI